MRRRLGRGTLVSIVIFALVCTVGARCAAPRIGQRPHPAGPSQPLQPSHGDGLLETAAGDMAAEDQRRARRASDERQALTPQDQPIHNPRPRP